MRKISVKQQKVLEYIKEFTQSQGYPPSVRDICKGVGLRSPSTVHAHIKSLQENGYLEKDDRKTRALKIPGMGGPITQVPILGRVTAGMPILAVEEAEGYFPTPLRPDAGEYFALHIQGESMRDAGILNGDLIVVRKQETARSGQIVVALLGEEATCKTLQLRGEEIWLVPENPAFPPIDGTGCRLLGVVVSVHRQYAV